VSNKDRFRIREKFPDAQIGRSGGFCYIITGSVTAWRQLSGPCADADSAWANAAQRLKEERDAE
jgi:hypothetical protein